MRTDQEFSQYASIGEFPGQSLVTRYQASDDPATGTAQTVNSMCAAALRDSITPQVMRATGTALLFSGPSEVEKVQCIYDWISRSIRFRQDEPVLRFALGLEEELDLLIAPARLLTMSRPAGDCDDFTMLTCAMLLCAGIPAEIVTIKSDPRDPSRFSHVYAQAITDQGVIPMDCSQAAQHGYPLGWEPQDHVYERKAWGTMNPPQIGTGLNGYHGMGGLGDCDADLVDMGMCTDTSTLGITTPLTDLGSGPVGGSSGGAVPMSSGSGGGGTSLNLTSLLTSLGTDATKITQLATLPSGYTLNAAGQPVLAGTAALTSGIGSLFSSPIFLLLIGAAILIPAMESGRR